MNYSKLKHELDPKLLAQHQHIWRRSSRVDQLMSSIEFINEHLFRTLRENPQLRERALKGVKHPKAVMKHRLVGGLHLSYSTLHLTGHLLNFYITTHKEADDPEKIRDNLSRAFKAELAYSSITHIQLVNLAQLSLDLHISLETLIYGTNDKHQIALYNYIYYSHLTKFEHDYLFWQAKKYHTVANFIKDVLKPAFSYRFIARNLGVSNQAVFDYVHHSDNCAVWRKVSVYNKMCRLGWTSPLKLMTYPQLTTTDLHKIVNEYQESITLKRKNRKLSR